MRNHEEEQDKAVDIITSLPLNVPFISVHNDEDHVVIGDTAQKDNDEIINEYTDKNEVKTSQLLSEPGYVRGNLFLNYILRSPPFLVLKIVTQKII